MGESQILLLELSVAIGRFEMLASSDLSVLFAYFRVCWLAWSHFQGCDMGGGLTCRPQRVPQRLWCSQQEASNLSETPFSHLRSSCHALHPSGRSSASRISRRSRGRLLAQPKSRSYTLRYHLRLLRARLQLINGRKPKGILKKLLFCYVLLAFFQSLRPTRAAQKS